VESPTKQLQDKLRPLISTPSTSSASSLASSAASSLSTSPENKMEVGDEAAHQLRVVTLAAKIKAGIDRSLADKATGSFVPFTVEHGVRVREYSDALDVSLKESRPVKIMLLKGNVIITEVPSLEHEETIRLLDALAAIYNRGVARDPIIGTGSTRILLGPNSAAEPDSGFRNRYVPRNERPKDGNGVLIPLIVVEVGVSEGYESLASIAAEYLSVGVLFVISLKFVIIENEWQSAFCSVYEPPGLDAANHFATATRTVSFGPTPILPAPSRDAILRSTRVAPEHFTGVGRGGDPCDHAGIPEYLITIPSQLIWHGVPPALVQADYGEWIIDLYEVGQVVRELQEG
jgi:Uma2 family endonuclease